MNRVTAPGVVETQFGSWHREVVADNDAEGRTVFITAVLSGERLLMAHVEREDDQ